MPGTDSAALVLGGKSMRMLDLADMNTYIDISGMVDADDDIPVFNAGDINGDGISDIAVASDNQIHIFYGNSGYDNTTNLSTAGANITLAAAAGFEIVGGGFAGLMAAHTFNRDGQGTCLLLDNHPIFGGEAKENEFDVDGVRQELADPLGELATVELDLKMQCQRLGARRDVEQVLAQQRLAAREDQRRHARGLEVLQHPEHLGRAELAREVDVRGDRVAVHARQVAAPHQVPDHHRPGRLAPWRAGSAPRGERRGPDDFLHETRDSEHRIAL